MNPMKTKRIKCTVQSIGLYCDGVGDQIEYSSKKKQSIPNTLLNSFEEIEYKIDDSALSSRKHSINGQLFSFLLPYFLYRLSVNMRNNITIGARI